MVKKNRTAAAAPVPAVAPARAPRKSSRLTAKRGGKNAQQQPYAGQPYVVQPPPGSAAWLTTPGTYTTRAKRRNADAVVVPVPQLPQLGTGATAVPGLVPGNAMVPVQPAELPARRPGEATREVVAAGSRLAWKHRWQLTPVVASATTAVGAGAVSPVLTVLGLAAVAGAGYWTAKKGPEEIQGRVWLSRVEREIVGRWAAGAAVWAAGLGIANSQGIHWTGTGFLVAIGALGVLTGTPVAGWLKSRKIRDADVIDGDAKELSDGALQLMAAWPHAVAEDDAPDKLYGSVVVDIDEPNPGTMVARIQLRPDVHGEDVATAETRKWLERALRMGVGTAKVRTVRDDAGQVEMVLTPSRHLEKTSRDWQGPRLHDDGRAPIAVTPSGRDANVRLFDKNGVRHIILIGSSNSGKSNAYNVVLLPMVLKGLSVVFYVDGKRGTSSPELAEIMDVAAITEQAWKRTIRMVYRILVAREERYGRMGQSRFDVWTADDPVIELVIDEGKTVQSVIDGKPEERMVEAISERGRALGVSLKIAVQNVEAGQVPGGMNVKTNLMGAGGNVIGLRPGTVTGATMTLSATSQEVDLRGLPPDGGWCAILTGGVVESEQARVEWIDGPDVIAPYLDGFARRTLTGADLTAADAPDEYEDGVSGLYSDRFTGTDWLAGMAQERANAGQTTLPMPSPAPVPSDSAAGEPTAAESEPVTGYDVAVKINEATASLRGTLRAAKVEQGEQSRQAVLDAIADAGADGATSKMVQAITGLAKATANRHIAKLVEDGKLVRSGDVIHLASTVQDDVPSAEDTEAGPALALVVDNTSAGPLPSEETAEAAGEPVRREAEAGERDTTRDVIVAHLREHGVVQKGELIKATLTSEANVRRVLDSLMASGEVERAGHGWYRLAQRSQAN
jgi:hypothetical protein